MPQRSRISLLDPEIQAEAERLMDAGATEQDCADYLNDILKKEDNPILKDGPISQVNVHRWKNSEYKAKKFAREIQEGMARYTEEKDRHSHISAILGWLTAKLAQETLDLDADPPPYDKYVQRLHQLVADVATIRKIENEDRWINAEERRVTVGENRLALLSAIAVKKEREKQDDYQAEAESCRIIKPVVEKLAKLAHQNLDDQLKNPNHPSGDPPDRLDDFGDTITEEQAGKLAQILTPEQMDQLGWGASETEGQENPDDGKRDPQP